MRRLRRRKVRSTLVTLHAVTLICNTPRRTAAGLGDVAAEGPLADAPVPHGTLEDGLGRPTRRVGAGQCLVAPVRLTRHLAEVGALGRIHLDADVVAALVFVFFYTSSLAREPGQRHAWPAAVGEGLSVDVQVLRRRRVEALGGSELVGAELSRAAVEASLHRPAIIAAIEPDLAIGGNDVPVGVEFLCPAGRRRCTGRWCSSWPTRGRGRARGGGRGRT